MDLSNTSHLDIRGIHSDWQSQPMPIFTNTRISGLALAIAVAVAAPSGPARAEAPQASARPRDGQHDFDFTFGRWKIHLRRLKKALAGSTEWVELSGSTFSRPLWGGKANVEEFEVASQDGKTRIQGLTLRLYSPDSGQWSLYWANQKAGQIGGVPTIGEFKDGRGEFYNQDMYEGKAILVRYVWSNITRNWAHFEQSFSTDGGKTWEVNWITDQTRVK
jgi:hypothetical protein